MRCLWLPFLECWLMKRGGRKEWRVCQIKGEMQWLVPWLLIMPCPIMVSSHVTVATNRPHCPVLLSPCTHSQYTHLCKHCLWCSHCPHCWFYRWCEFSVLKVSSWLILCLFVDAVFHEGLCFVGCLAAGCPCQHWDKLLICLFVIFMPLDLRGSVGMLAHGTSALPSVTYLC